MSRWKQRLPGLAVLLVLGAALAAPVLRARASGAPAEVDYLYYPNCTMVTQGGVGSAVPYGIVAGEGITQRLGTPDNFASSIMFEDQPTSATTRYDLVYWDPNTLAPAAGHLAIRSRSYAATSSPYSYSRKDYLPPVITKAFGSVAEPPPSELAIEHRNLTSYYGDSLGVMLVANDATTMPAGLRLLPDGSRVPLPGSHPVFAYQLCGGDAFLQSLRVVQCVMKGEDELSANNSEYIQKFRIPLASTVRWIELAFGRHSPSGQLSWGRLQVLDAQGQSDPPLSFSNPIIDAQISVWTGSGEGAQWDSHVDLASFPALQANHDYWLVVNPVGDYWFRAKELHGNESSNFKTMIGKLWSRDFTYVPATVIPDRALAFRIIGTPVENVGVGAPAPSRAAFALAVAPNPARGAATLSWSGAQGGVRFEMLDARGRRVAQGMSAQGESGRWSWNAAGDDGRALPAGLYFVRARDEAGRSTSARVTVVR